MPELNPGEERVAIVTFPTKPAGLPCTAELWLASNGTKVATSGEILIVATGADQAISLPITMPSAEGTYPVYLYVSSNGQLIAAFLGDEDVAIVVPEILRPNAAGDECLLLGQAGALCPNHYQNVDDVEADDDTTYVGTETANSVWTRDLYNIPAGKGGHTIASVKVYLRCKTHLAADQVCVKAAIKSGTEVSEGAAFLPAPAGSWNTYLAGTWATDPNTGVAWTWDAIDALQVGVSMRQGKNSDVANHYCTYCTQVFLEVDYTPDILYTCPHCDKVLSTFGDYASHLEGAHKDFNFEFPSKDVFSYKLIYWSPQMCWEGAYTIDIGWEISNTTSKVITHDVELWVGGTHVYCTQSGIPPYVDTTKTGSRRTISLQPGEKYNYRYNGYFTDGQCGYLVGGAPAPCCIPGLVNGGKYFLKEFADGEYVNRSTIKQYY